MAMKALNIKLLNMRCPFIMSFLSHIVNFLKLGSSTNASPKEYRDLQQYHCVVKINLLLEIESQFRPFNIYETSWNYFKFLHKLKYLISVARQRCVHRKFLQTNIEDALKENNIHISSLEILLSSHSLNLNAKNTEYFWNKEYSITKLKIHILQ